MTYVSRRRIKVNGRDYESDVDTDVNSDVDVVAVASLGVVKLRFANKRSMVGGPYVMLPPRDFVAPVMGLVNLLSTRGRLEVAS